MRYIAGKSDGQRRGFLKAKGDGALLLTCTIAAGEGYSPFGILIHPSEDLNPSFAIVFEPTRQSASIMQRRASCLPAGLAAPDFAERLPGRAVPGRWSGAR